MKLSIIIPVYNIEKYIRECLESIIGQSDSKCQVILVDDGSTDSTGIICDEYAKQYDFIKVIHKKNGGQSSARNFGVKEASGEYIMFLDGDDSLMENSLQEVINEMDCDCDVIAYNYRIVNEKTGKIDSLRGHILPMDKGIVRSGEEFLKSVLKLNPAFNWYPWLYCFKREYYNENNYHFSEGKLYEDYELIYRILLDAKSIKCLPKSVYIYRINRNGATTQVRSVKSIADYLGMLKNNIEDILERQMSDELRKMLLNNMTYAYYVALIVYFSYPKFERKMLFEKLNEMKYAIKYTNSGKQKYIKWLIKMLGIRPTAFMMFCRAKLLHKI